MTIEKAIELLSAIGPLRGTLSTEEIMAMQLGIEALVRIRYQRKKPSVKHSTPLASETSEK